MNFYGKDFLKISDFSEDELRYMLATAKRFKEMKKARQNHKYFPDLYLPDYDLYIEKLMQEKKNNNIDLTKRWVYVIIKLQRMVITWQN